MTSSPDSFSDSFSLESGFIPEEPLHPEGAAFLAQVNELLDGQPKDSAAVQEKLAGWEGLLEKIAGELYQMASMLVGEGEQSISLIEHVVTNLDFAGCHDQSEARHNSRLALGARAIEVLTLRDGVPLSAPSEEEGPVSCIEDDDLEAAGVTRSELEQMLSDSDNQHLRSWLEGLDAALRVIFVLRAIGGLTSVEVAVLLADHGGPRSTDWTPDAVRSSFRQALCSLASQLIHSAVTK